MTRTTTVLLATALFLLMACESSNATNPVTDTVADAMTDTGGADDSVGTDVPTDTPTDTGSADDSVGTDVPTDTPTDTGSADCPVDADAAADALTDTATCPHDVPLMGSCTSDCDCEPALACRGLPGQRICAVPCSSTEDCETGDAPCANPACDMSLGACLCWCDGMDCGDRFCLNHQCVDCMEDADCSRHDCSEHSGELKPMCHPTTTTCVCAGRCGDGTCDDVESAIDTCPDDCPSTCMEGTRRSFSCMEGELVDWCVCESGAWNCLEDPATQCHGESACVQHGGMCVASAEDCFEGSIVEDPQGCGGDSPLCCQRESCAGPGDQYYPYLGICCPGLHALHDVFPMEGGMTGEGGVSCYPGCWVLTCAPCGDSTCSPHLGETPCNCPEDCPLPPYDFDCSSGDPSDCGPIHCTQDDDVCTDHTPSCQDGLCSWSSQAHPGQVCDPTTRACGDPR